MKYLKFVAIIGILLLSTTIITTSVNATSPRFLRMKYDSTTETLTVKVFHLSPAVRIHYIYRVEVDINGQVYQVQLFQKQPRILLQTYIFNNVTASPGDTITASAYCVLWGFVQKSMVV